MTREHEDWCHAEIKALSAKNELLRAEVERLETENARLKEIEIKYDQFISGAFI